MTAPARDPLAPTLLRYASGRLYKHALGVVVAFLRPRLLTPDHFGIWTLLRAVPSYASYAHLGARSSMRLLVPRHLARGERDCIAEIVDTTWTGSAALNGIVAAGLLSAAALPALRLETRIGFACMAAVVLLQFAEEFAISLLRAHERFPAVNAATYLGATVTFLLTPPALYWFGLLGLFGSIIVSHAAVLLYLRRKMDHQARWRWNGALFRDLVRRGLPVVLTNVAILLVQTTDRFVVGCLLGTEEVGQYGIAALVIGFLSNVPGAAREVLEPRMMRELEDGDSIAAIEEYVLKPIANTAWLMPFAIGPIYLLVPEVLPLVLPRYADGVVPTQVLLVGVYFLTLSFATHTLIFARNWQWAALGVALSAFVVDVGLCVGAIRMGYGLPGVAAASSVACLLLFVGLLSLCASRLKDLGTEWGRHLVASAIALPLAAGLALGLIRLAPHWIGHRLGAACASTIGFVIVFALLHRVAASRCRLITRWPSS